jgi:hypothetical protein
MSTRRSPEERQASQDATSLRKVSEKMAKIEGKIDSARMGSEERLALLRTQASLSDERETLRDQRR